MNEIDRLNLFQAAAENPNFKIVFNNGFFDGTDKKEFGLMPHEWNGQTLHFCYKHHASSLENSQNKC